MYIARERRLRADGDQTLPRRSVWVPHSASPWAGDVAEKLITTAGCGRRPVVDGQAGEQYASLTRLELPVAVKALAGVWLWVAQLDAKRVIPVHVHVLD